MASVIEDLIGRGRPFLVMPETGAPTVRAAASAHGIDLGEVIRTEVMTTSAGHALMVVRAVDHLDLGLAREAVNDPDARLATDAEIRALAAGCDVAAVPPIASLRAAPIYVDPAIARMTQVVFPAGRAGVLVCMERVDLFREDPYVVVPLTRASVAESPAEPEPPTSRRAVLAGDDLLPVHMLDRGVGRPADVA